MTQGLNRVTLIGNLGADPELKFTPNGGAVLRVRLATTESYVDKNKQRQDRTEWHTVVVWGNRGEALNKILSKGRSIYVEGRIQTRSWDDKEGNKRYATDIDATNVILLGGASRGDSSGNANSSRGGTQRDEQFADDFGNDSFGGGGADDDIPF